MLHVFLRKALGAKKLTENDNFDFVQKYKLAEMQLVFWILIRSINRGDLSDGNQTAPGI